MCCRNRTSYEHFKLKLCSCAQSHALGTGTKFQLEILTINVITGIVYFCKIILRARETVKQPPGLTKDNPWWVSYGLYESTWLGHSLGQRQHSSCVLISKRKSHYTSPRSIAAIMNCRLGQLNGLESEASDLTHLPLVPHICVSKSGQYWFR